LSARCWPGQGGGSSAGYVPCMAVLMGLNVDLPDAGGKKGIRVNFIAPGIIDTPMRATAIRQAGLDPAQIDLSFKTSLPFDGDAWDVARAALFLPGPDGRYITGLLLP